jgi:hypothetical protein
MARALGVAHGCGRVPYLLTTPPHAADCLQTA